MYNRNDDRVKCKEASSKINRKIRSSEVTFVHNCVGSSSGKKISTDCERAKALFSENLINSEITTLTISSANQ